MPTFYAHRISANHNLLFPDRIEVDSDRVTYYKGAIIGYQSTVILRANISSVRLLSNLLFADIVIESSGGRMVRIDGLSKKDALAVYRMLQE